MCGVCHAAMRSQSLIIPALFVLATCCLSGNARNAMGTWRGWLRVFDLTYPRTWCQKYLWISNWASMRQVRVECLLCNFCLSYKSKSILKRWQDSIRCMGWFPLYEICWNWSKCSIDNSELFTKPDAIRLSVEWSVIKY